MNEFPRQEEYEETEWKRMEGEVNGGSRIGEKPIECKELRRHCLSDRNYSIQDFISIERGHSGENLLQAI